MTPKEFSEFALPLAAAAANKYGINPIGLMAQCALETGWGKHAPGNMYFGIKAGSNWKGKVQDIRTTEYINGIKRSVICKFRAYDDPKDSFMDYAKLIASLPRYKTAMMFPGYNDVDKYLGAIAAAGYATSPTYAANTQSVARTIKKYISEEDLQFELKKK